MKATVPIVCFKSMEKRLLQTSPVVIIKLIDSIEQLLEMIKVLDNLLRNVLAAAQLVAERIHQRVTLLFLQQRKPEGKGTAKFGAASKRLFCMGRAGERVFACVGITGYFRGTRAHRRLLTAAGKCGCCVFEFARGRLRFRGRRQRITDTIETVFHLHAFELIDELHTRFAAFVLEHFLLKSKARSMEISV